MAKCTGVRCPMQYGYKVDECNHTDCPYRTEPITNADRIRAMSDEELCDFIMDAPAIPCDNKISAMMEENGCNDCQKCIMDWLQHPAEEVK